MTGRMRLARWAAALFLVFASTGPGAAQTADGTRVALVIGNSAYQAVPNLPNPVNDATAVAESLERIGFDVTIALDLDHASMRRALQDFELLVANADVAVVYYAGHGIQVGGTNFLIPVDAELRRDTHVLDEAVSLDRVMVAIEQANALRLVILDACRDNPFTRTMEMTGGDRAVSRGLARVDPTGATMVVFATRDGMTADDGDGDHSPFTFALLTHIETPGLEVGFVFRYVRDDVMQATAGLQEPVWDASLGREPIYFVPAIAATVVNPQVAIVTTPTPGDAAQAYRDTLAIDTVEAWSAFLRYHSTGLYADLARAALNKLLEQQGGTTPPAGDVGVVPVFLSPGDAEGGAAPEPAEEEAVAIADPAGGGAAPGAALPPEPPAADGAGGPPAPVPEPEAPAVEAEPEAPAEDDDAPAIDDPALAAAAACDSFAAYDQDPDRAATIPPVGDLELGGNTRPALEACRIAVELNPDDRRQLFQLARVAFIANRAAESVEAAMAAAELGSPPAMAIVGLAFEYGLTVAQDLQQAVAWYRRAADSGGSDGMLFLGYLYESGTGVAVDLDQSLRLYEQAAELGNAGAIAAIAYRYQAGLGVPLDLAAARDWYLRASEAGDSYAMLALAQMFEFGNGGAVDYAEALHWYEQAAAYGLGSAMEALGYFYEVGLGVAVDFPTAQSWYEAGANAGDVGSMYALGRFYEEGIGTEQDYEEAAIWYSQAALSGEMPYALIRLGQLFDQGLGVAQDFDTARGLWEEAASAGESDALVFLGYLYEFGRGVAQDYQRAASYYVEALSSRSAMALSEFLNYADDYPVQILLAIETFLVSEGFLTGKADGLFDGATLQALRQLGDA